MNAVLGDGFIPNLQAISDLLLGVFCVPVTIVGQILRNFIFGHFMCKIIPYFQGKQVTSFLMLLVSMGDFTKAFNVSMEAINSKNVESWSKLQ